MSDCDFRVGDLVEFDPRTSCPRLPQLDTPWGIVLRVGYVPNVYVVTVFPYGPSDVHCIIKRLVYANQS